MNSVAHEKDILHAVETDNVFHIVGNKFADFADGNTILSYTAALNNVELLARISQGVFLGQGINADEASLLKQRLKFLAGTRFIPVIEHISQKVARELVHKAHDKNVLITAPQAMGGLVFESKLVVDDDCAEMSDHQNGEHIQGALLVEAARQMFMACYLSHDITPEFSRRVGKMAFTLSESNVRYENFVFPVDTHIRLSFEEITINGSTASGRTKIQFKQFNKACCEVEFLANAYPLKFLKSLEKRSARKARNQLHSLETLTLISA